MTALRTAGITVCFLVCVAACAAEPVQIPCAVQIATTASDGKHTVPEIIAACRNQGIKAVILADRDLMQWEYGVWPLRNVFKKTVRHKSLFTYGIRRYLAELENLQKQNPDLIVIAGVESAPFYYWKGSVFNDDLTLVDWHKHVLAVGLKDAGDYAMLPVIGNKKALALPFIARNLYLFWPLLLIGAGAVWCKRRRMRAGLIAVAIGAVFLVNNFPFRYYRFDQYRGDQGSKPYQGYIDYVNAQGALAFWVHPEACNQCRVGNVRIDTEAYPLELYRTSGYTGFSILYDGEKKIGAHAGMWDRLLEAYCQGKRRQPAWAIGTLGFDNTGDLGAALEDLRTVVLAERFSREAVLDALRQGSAYVVSGKNSRDFILDAFSLYDPASATERTMGQTLTAESAPLVRIRGHLLNGQAGPFTVQLIKDARVVKEFKAQAPFEITYQDAETGPEMTYFRAAIQGNGVRVFTNPVFLRRKLP